MTSRIRLIITARPVRHLLLFAVLVTSQLHGQETVHTKFVQPPLQTGVRILPAEEVIIRARTQEKLGDLYKLRGDVEITYRSYVFRADEVLYNRATGDINASGGVVLDGGPRDEHIEATRGTYNLQNETGIFYDVVGSIGARFRGKNVVLTSSNPFMFTGKEVRKTGRNRFTVLHGTVTSCTLPHPLWTFNSEKVDVVAGEGAKMYHSTFRLHGLPVFYFPYATHPVDTLGRQSGFLMPNIGQSSSKGFIFGDSFYWAINRSMDATLGAEYWSARGWAQHAEFRVRPSTTSDFDFRYNGVLDRGAPVSHQNQSGEDVRLNYHVDLPNGFRAVSDINYLSSFLYRQAFSESFSQAVNSEVKSVAFVAKAINGYSLGIMASRYQNFQSTTRGDQILMLHMPSLEVSSVERRIHNSRLMWSFDSTAEGVSRREPGFTTGRLVGRFDLNPRVSLPLVWKGWGLRTEIGLRDTYYTKQLASGLGPVGTAINEGLNRRALEGSIELRPPALERIFTHEVMGRKIKHVIEPLISYNYVTGVDNFNNTILFDGRDILADTSELEYGFTQRLYAKRHIGKHDPRCDLMPKNPETNQQPGAFIPGTAAVPIRCEDEGSSTREILSWDVRQKYFFNSDFGGALIPGTRNVFTTTDDLTGIAFLTDQRNWSPIVSKLRVQTSANTDIQWQLDYDTKKGWINASTAMIDYRFGEFFVGGSQAFLHTPGPAVDSTGTPIPTPEVFNQYRALVGYGHPNKRGLSAGGSIGFDQHVGFLQYGAVQSTYNWDCCGVSIEYRRFALGSARNENQFRFAFTLLNIGTFGNLRRQERLF